MLVTKKKFIQTVSELERSFTNLAALQVRMLGDIERLQDQVQFSLDNPPSRKKGERTHRGIVTAIKLKDDGYYYTVQPSEGEPFEIRGDRL